MNPLNVKSTMLHRLLDLVSPHYCCSCGEIGSILCESCKYDITSERCEGCLLCGRLAPLGTCKYCYPDIQRTWCGGERTGSLEELINRYKFEYAQAAYIPLGDILLSALPDLPKRTVVVPIPTIRPHIRQRGYDHALLVSRYIAAQGGFSHAQPLRRKTATVQRDASRRQRIAQAKEAFEVRGSLDAEPPYLLIDDVATTGATLRYAAQAMKNAGAEVVWAAAAARQPLD